MRSHAFACISKAVAHPTKQGPALGPCPQVVPHKYHACNLHPPVELRAPRWSQPRCQWSSTWGVGMYFGCLNHFCCLFAVLFFGFFYVRTFFKGCQRGSWLTLVLLFERNVFFAGILPLDEHSMTAPWPWCGKRLLWKGCIIILTNQVTNK